MEEREKFEHFLILRLPNGSLWELGRGAMGVTYKAFDTNLRADVALKVINPQYLNSETARQRFLREARSAASLRHPNVATVFHLGNSGDRFFYAMEYVEGETIENKIQKEGPFSPELALRVTRQVTRALVAADRQKLVHRDIKPSNIMLVHDDGDDHLSVKVIDFGLAKSIVAAADQSVTMTMAGFVGTPQFASPEQLEEKPIDIRSDIYSLGATLWYMLTGRPPFHGAIASVIHQHLSQPLAADMLLKFHPSVSDLLQKMLAKKPEDRFQSPGDLKRELDQVVSELRGLSPTLVPLSPFGSDALTGTSTSGFATGQLLQNRYQLLGRSSFDANVFRANDLHTNRVVAIRPIPSSSRYDTQRIDLLQKEIAKLKSVNHPNLLVLIGLETHERGLFIVSEWAPGITLHELLRVRRELSLEETVKIVAPLARFLDSLVEQGLANGNLSLRQIFVELPQNQAEDFLRLPIGSWPPFVIKVDALSFAQIAPEYLMEPTQTVVGKISVQRAYIQQMAGLVYELLGGVSTSASGSTSHLNPLPSLSEVGNSVLRTASVSPKKFSSSSDFLAELEATQKSQQHAVLAPAGKLAQRPREEVGTSDHVFPLVDSGNRKIPLFLRLATVAVLFLAVVAMGAVLLVNFRHRTNDNFQAENAAVARQGAIRLTTKPEGATVKWNGQEIGKTPLNNYVLPVGTHVLDLVLPGYDIRPVELQVASNTINDLGTINLIQQVCQLDLRSEPAGLGFQVIDSKQKIIAGETPPALSNLPSGLYSVHLRRVGWPDYVEQVNLQPNISATVQHTFQEVNVELKSDPPGTTIFLGQRELGKTPLTVSLPPEPAELVSRLGKLTPVTRDIVPNPDGPNIVQFKHEYGILSVTSDRPNGEVVFGNDSLGRPPFEQIVPIGLQQIVWREPGIPDEVRTADIQAGKHVSIQFLSPVSPAVAVVNSPAPMALLPEQKPASTPVSEKSSEEKPLRRVVAAAAPKRVRKPRPTPTEQTPVYHTKEEYDRAKDAAYEQFDRQWDGRKSALDKEKDYLDDQIDRAEGANKAQLENRKKTVEYQRDKLDDQKDAAKQALKRRWGDD